MLPIALSLLQFVPEIAGLFGGNKAEAVAGKVVQIAQAVTGQGTPDAALQALQADPAKVLEFQKAVLDQRVELAKIAAQTQIELRQADSADIAAVNKTLQTEAMGGSWLQRNHHAIESIGTVALVWAVYFVLPLARIPVPAIPESAWITLGAILGVTAWQRGQANVRVATASAQQPPAPVETAAIEAVR